MRSEQQEEGEAGGWRRTLGTVAAFPTKFVLASSLILVNLFQNIAQQRRLKELVREVNESPKANQQAKQELFAYLSQFTSLNTTLHPIMVKEYRAVGGDQEYRIGLLINGEVSWQSILGKVKEHIKVDPHVSLSFFCQKRVITQGSIRQLHQLYQREDGIMYVQYIRMEAYG